jgi:hypothetical protein
MQYITPRRKMAQRKGLVLTIIISVAIVMGIVASYRDGQVDVAGLVSNLSTEIIGGVLTFLLIEQFILKNEDELTQRKVLISKLENHDNGIVKQVIAELRANGWLEDGSLYGWFLQRANFSGIYLKDLNTNGLGLYKCNLQDTGMSDEQLLRLNDFRLCTMPNGKRYDGRYCLSGDLEWAVTRYSLDFMTISVAQMADYYQVSEEEFIAGQKWALENLTHFGYDIPPYLQKLALEWGI